MFSLEQSITAWRKQMLAGGIKAPVPLDELEGHLREEVDRRVREGIQTQLAFEEAVLKMGAAGELKAEFSRGWRWRDLLEIELVDKKRGAQWLPTICLVTANAVFLAFSVMVIGSLGKTSVMTHPEGISAMAAMLISDLLFSSGFLGRRLFPVIPRKGVRLALGASLSALIALGMMVLISRIDGDIGRLMMEFCWAFFVPMGALGGLIFGLERAAQGKSVG
jgi:hypothetical protein